MHAFFCGLHDLNGFRVNKWKRKCKYSLKLKMRCSKRHLMTSYTNEIWKLRASDNLFFRPAHNLIVINVTESLAKI